MGLTVCLKKGRVLILCPKLPYLGGRGIRWVKDSETHVPTSPWEGKEVGLGEGEPPKVTESCSRQALEEGGWTNPLSFLGVPAMLSTLKPRQSAHM